MSRSNHIPKFLTVRADLALFQSNISETQIGRWRINGFPAQIIVWTTEEWEQLTDRPKDAQYYPCGVWCALRME